MINDLFEHAIRSLFGNDIDSTDPSVQIATRPEFGDYQANFAMRLAKVLHKKPIDIANEVIDQLKDNSMFKLLEPSGPGFINITLNDEFLAKTLHTLARDERLGVQQTEDPQIIVVDYANANVAKEMHVGHIRSIVIGDVIVRLLSFLGHKVIGQSHLGDWGTQFGMLIEYLYETNALNKPHTVSDLDPLYKKSKERFDSDPIFADKARARVVALQSGDEETLQIWRQLVIESLAYFQKIYDKLDVLLTEEDARGESFYNPFLSEMVNSLEQKGLAHNDAGAIVIYLDEFSVPMIIRKKDGGHLYATTDLAAARFRIEKLGAKRIIYLTDVRQKQHFAMLFAALKKLNWAADVRLEHIPFGAILGKDNKPFKTRSGESIKLITLLEESEVRAKEIVHSKNPDLDEENQNFIAHHIGIGALKYADLRADKAKDYVFDWDKLLAFEGNTAPYLQNAYVRISAIFRKGNVNVDEIRNSDIFITTDIEHVLATKLLQFSDMINAAADDLLLHRICDYLYDLAATYHRFYETCPILSLKDKSIINSRLLISDMTARTLKVGLSLLGVHALYQM